MQTAAAPASRSLFYTGFSTWPQTPVIAAGDLHRFLAAYGLDQLCEWGHKVIAAQLKCGNGLAA